MNILYGTDFDTPEQLFCINPSAESGLYIDALNATLSRAVAVSELLIAVTADLDDGISVNQEVLADAIWQLNGLLKQAQTIADYR